MCSRAERKRRRRATSLGLRTGDAVTLGQTFTDAKGATWRVYAPKVGRGTGMTRAAGDAFRSAVAVRGGVFTFPPEAKIAFLDLAAATGDTVENIERAARSIVDRCGPIASISVGPDGVIQVVKEGQVGAADVTIALDPEAQ